MNLFNISKLLNILSNPQNKLKVVHITGTNGKGSTCAYLANILSISGLQVGRFNSPFLLHPRDSIKINNEPVTQLKYEETMKFINRTEFEHDIVCTEFEKLTICAFILLEECDVCLIEVGLGGRLDATNVFEKPLVCAFSCIGLDHESVLGNSVSKIALEKSGILKDCCHVVIGKQIFSDAITVLRDECGKKRCMYEILDDNQVTALLTSHGIRIEPGSFQNDNIALALKIANFLFQKLEITPPASELCKTAIENTRWKGRLDWVQVKGLGTLLVDGAHNTLGATVLSNYVQKHIRDKGKKVKWILGFTNTKDYKKILEILVSPCDSVCFCEFDSPETMSWIKCAPVQILSECLEGIHTNQQSFRFKSIQECLLDLESNKNLTSSPNPLALPDQSTIVLSGSLYLISTFYRLIDEYNSI